MHVNLIDIIDKLAIEAPDLNDSEVTNTYQKYLEQTLSAKCIILASSCLELQRQHEDMDPHEINHLKKMYGGQSKISII